jgi:hypothetical protein
MSRKRRPDKVIRVRMDGSIARCGDCGQRLWRVVDGQLDPSIERGLRGRRLIDGAWRKTRYADRQRQRTRAGVNDPTLTPDERHVKRDRLAIDMFPRSGPHSAEVVKLTPPAIARAPSPEAMANFRPHTVVSGIGARNPMGMRRGVAYQLKDTKDAEGLSPELAAALRLPARVECPRCSPERPVINIIGED